MSEDELREHLTKVITDAYMLGKSDQLMKLNDFAELSTGIIKKAHNLYERIALESRIDERKKFKEQLKQVASDWPRLDLSPISHLHDLNNLEIRELKAQLTNLDNSNKDSK